MSEPAQQSGTAEAPGGAPPGQDSGPLTADQAQIQLEALRADRIAGKVTSAEYFERHERLARTAAGEQLPPADPPPRTAEERGEAEYAKWMAPPEELGGYGRLPQIPGLESAQAEGFDAALRTALKAGGVPVHLANPIVEGLIRADRAVGTGDPALHVQKVAAQLRQTWGDEYQSRVDRVADLVARMAETDDGLGKMLDRAPHLIADLQAMEYLDRVAAHRANRKR